jgi:hypothetical protein
MAKITLERGEKYAPGCFFICRVIDGRWSKYDDKNTVLVQTDWDFPSLAKDFGYDGPDDRPTEAVYDFLDGIAGTGTTIDDPGYFNKER